MIEYLSEEEAEKQGTNKKVISLAEFVYGMNKETDSFSFEGLKILFQELNKSPYTIQTDYEYWAKCWVECSFEDFLERVRENCYFRSCDSTKESILEYLVEGAEFISNLVTVEGLTDNSVVYYERGKKVPHKKLRSTVEPLTKDEKPMKVVTAEDISRIFTEMEKKYGKDKAIGIFVGTTQESVRLIDGKSAAQILFEKLQEYEAKEKESFEYKGYTLKFGLIRNGYGKMQEGGSCEELKYSTFSKTKEQNIINFKLAVDFCLDCKRMNIGQEESKPKNKAITHLMTQLDRLAQKDKENNVTPFELRGQLIEIYHLFGKILGLTLEDIHKYYFERAEK